MVNRRRQRHGDHMGGGLSYVLEGFGVDGADLPSTFCRKDADWGAAGRNDHSIRERLFAAARIATQRWPRF